MKAIWQARRETPSHVDDWLMTYADVITLLLCLFAVFLSVSISSRVTSHKTEVARAVSLPIPQRAPTTDAAPEAPADPESSPTVVQAAPAKANAVPIEASTVATLTPSAPPSAPPVAAVPAVPPMSPSAIAVPIPAASVTPEATPAVKSPAPEFRPAGDRITTLEMNSATFFDSGSATLSKAGETVLQEVTVELKLDMFRDYQITVEGHTDDTPIHTAQFPSNWELSTARAAAVVHFFLEQGIPARKLRAAGYADTFPKAPNRDTNGNPIPENQSQNRRVVIRLEKIDKAERSAATPPGAGFVPPSDLQ